MAKGCFMLISIKQTMNNCKPELFSINTMMWLSPNHQSTAEANFQHVKENFLPPFAAPVDNHVVGLSTSISCPWCLFDFTFFLKVELLCAVVIRLTCLLSNHTMLESLVIMGSIRMITCLRFSCCMSTKTPLQFILNVPHAPTCFSAQSLNSAGEGKTLSM